jgi:chitinase
MVAGFADDPQNFAFRVVKQQNPDLTILVSVGGWLWSTNFSDMALTPRAGPVIQSAGLSRA